MSHFTLLNKGLLLFAAGLCFSTLALAQPCPPGCPEVLPIDGGIGFLIAAGVAYGAKKINDSRKNKSE